MINALILLLLLLLLSHISCVRLCGLHRWQPTRLPHPWDSPGKNTWVGCHFLLQCMKVKSKSKVAQSCLTLRNPKDCSPPGSSIHGISQARVLEWAAIAFSQCLNSNGLSWILPNFQSLSEMLYSLESLSSMGATLELWFVLQPFSYSDLCC